MHPPALFPSGAGSCLSPSVKGSLARHKGQGYEFCKSASFYLQVAHRQQMRCPVRGVVNMPEHDGCGGA